MNLSALAYKHLKLNKNTLIIVKDNIEINNLSLAFKFFGAIYQKKLNICPFYSYEIPPHSSIKPSSIIVSRRIRSLYNLINSSENIVFITNLNALVQPVIGEEEFIDKLFVVSQGDILKMEDFLKTLLNGYYERVEYLQDVGDFSKKGYIVDVFSPIYDKPVRIEYFDDEVESIKLIHLENYRTFGKLDSAIFPAAREYPYSEDEFGYVLLKDKKFLDDYDLNNFSKYSTIGDSDLKAVFRLIGFYKEDGLFNKKQRVEDFLDECEFESAPFELSKLFPENYTLDEKIEVIKRASLKSRVVIACGSKVRVERLGKFFEDKGVGFSLLRKNPFELSPGVYLSEHPLVDGIFDRETQLAIVTFSDFFGKKESYVSKIHKKHKPIVSFSVGDKVVHRKYGIAVYKGLKRIEIDGKEEDFFELEYDEGDRIYLPVYNAELIDEYVGGEPLSSLRNNKWEKSQEVAKKSIKKILTELVNTYAKRQLIKRKPYDVDLYEIREFEAMFDYDETADQQAAIEDVKMDMAKDTPMDRLICGDVSFGKTEVAMRAIAICVFNYKQAVFMVPTTLLSIQHYRTVKERFASFPVTIALLNRFTTKKEREKILEGVKKGSIDILIATHSVYSDKIEFANLGLVVVDEEHRFGVKVKEHLKSRYPNVDMLYMSATPIPRTLSMSLNGVMDISVIKTPPQERKPIETIISRRKSSIIRDAILREISRYGRVYFVHNTIEDINNVKEELDNLVPFSRKDIVHAKMPKSKIKDVFERFNNGDIDVLVSTSIIESGLDIRSVDTIIIDNADRFGLSDLYQLRGRVGRGDRIAYAYLLYKGKLTEGAAKRLQYMGEFIERGAGFNLALKDMELRGYGNILGKDQSGKIRSMGYSVYMSLIEEAIRELKNQPVERDVEIKHTFDAYVPDEFAEGEKKVEIYKRLSLAKNIDDIDDLKEELIDRFGSLPSPLDNLILIVKLKVIAKKAYVKKLLISPKGTTVEFYVDAAIDTDKLIDIVNKKHGRFISETAVYFGLLGKSLSDIYFCISDVLQKIVIN